MLCPDLGAASGLERYYEVMIADDDLRLALPRYVPDGAAPCLNSCLWKFYTTHPGIRNRCS